VILGERHDENPRFSVPDWAWDIVRLWRMYQGGMGVGHLPHAGGAVDQSCILLEAFGILSATEAALKPEK